MAKPIIVGAVIYDPKVVLIWDIIKDFFQAEGCPIDYVFYSNYELLADALLARHVDIAWNSPLAWVDCQRRTGGTCRALAMRDTDQDRVTRILVRTADGISALAGLKGKRLGVGALDSPQATLLPLRLLRQHGIDPDRDLTVRRFDLLVGKHGDHIGGEKEALKALQAGEVEACAVLDLNWDLWSQDGTADPSKISILATTDPFDHCNFTVLSSFPKAEEERWCKALFAMTYDNPAHREMMDMEGLKAWLPGRTELYAGLEEAVDQQRFFAAV